MVTHELAQLSPVDEGRALLERVADRPWAALIEFLLIGVVVYLVLRFLQGTRGARLARACLSILAVSFGIAWLIAERFEFERINVLYPYFILGVLLISLVAFQTELRRMLIRLGEGRWFRRWVWQGGRIVDPIVTAVDRLSTSKTGALIAIERSTEIGGVTETGVPIDAVVTAELLETIFYPGTALHDMGVIIREGRVIAARCQFPLAESGELEGSLGSRHRAALGMSQEADAVVIVVSEETGTVSVAMRGNMRRSLKASTLRDTLNKALVPDTDKVNTKEKG